MNCNSVGSHEQWMEKFKETFNTLMEKTGLSSEELSKELARDLLIKYLENPLAVQSLEFYGLAPHQISATPNEEFLSFFKSCYLEIKKFPEEKRKVILNNFKYYYAPIFQIIVDEETKEIARRKKICNLTQEFPLKFHTDTQLADLIRKKIPPYTYSSVSVETRDVNYYDKKTKTFKLLKCKVVILKNDFMLLRPLFHSRAVYIHLKSIRDYLLDVNSIHTSKDQGKRYIRKLANTHNLVICIPIDLSRKARIELISKKMARGSIEKVIKSEPSSKQKIIITRSVTRILVDFLHRYLLEIFKKIKQIFNLLNPPKKIQFSFSKN